MTASAASITEREREQIDRANATAAIPVVFASPMRATDEQLVDLPPAFVIVDEADVLRDEGEAYAARLRAAGVAVTTVRYDRLTHDFMMLDPLSETHATRAADARAITILRDAQQGA
jgi:acetyl esterase